MQLKNTSVKLTLILLFATPIVFVCLILALLTYSKLTKQSIHTPRNEVETKPLHTRANPANLEIAGIKLDLPIEESSVKNNEWQISENGISHLDISANPGENGNIVLYGHNKRVILGSLPYVSIGSQIKVTTADNNTYLYKIYEKKQVLPDDISIALATDNEVLTIYTCDSVLDTKRYMIRATPLESTTSQ